MRGLLRQDKKGVSVMVGYVLLIVIAISLSIAVFAYLKLYLPTEGPKCSEDVVLTIEELNCLDGEVSVTLTNRGLFSANGVFLRIGESGRVYKEVLNKDDNYIFNDDTSGKLEPGEVWNSPDYTCKDVSCRTGETLEFEIEPFIYVDNEPALCEKSVVSRLVQCF